MLDKFKVLSEQIAKADDKVHQAHEKSIALEKENLQLKSKVAVLQQEIAAKDSQIDKLNDQKNELQKLIAQGKDYDKQQVEKLTNDIARERKEHERIVQELR